MEAAQSAQRLYLGPLYVVSATHMQSCTEHTELAIQWLAKDQFSDLFTQPFFSAILVTIFSFGRCERADLLQIFALTSAIKEIHRQITLSHASKVGNRSNDRSCEMTGL